MRDLDDLDLDTGEEQPYAAQDLEEELQRRGTLQLNLEGSIKLEVKSEITVKEAKSGYY